MGPHHLLLPEFKTVPFQPRACIPTTTPAQKVTKTLPNLPTSTDAWPQPNDLSNSTSHQVTLRYFSVLQIRKRIRLEGAELEEHQKKERERKAEEDRKKAEAKK